MSEHTKEIPRGPKHGTPGKLRFFSCQGEISAPIPNKRVNAPSIHRSTPAMAFSAKASTLIGIAGPQFPQNFPSARMGVGFILGAASMKAGFIERSTSRNASLRPKEIQDPGISSLAGEMKQLVCELTETFASFQSIDQCVQNQFWQTERLGSSNQPDCAGMDQRMRRQRHQPFRCSRRWISCFFSR